MWLRYIALGFFNLGQLDQLLGRFDLSESTDVKVHPFVFRGEGSGKAVLPNKFKLLRQLCAMYPRKHAPDDSFFLKRRIQVCRINSIAQILEVVR